MEGTCVVCGMDGVEVNEEGKCVDCASPEETPTVVEEVAE